MRGRANYDAVCWEPGSSRIPGKVRGIIHPFQVDAANNVCPLLRFELRESDRDNDLHGELGVQYWPCHFDAQRGNQGFINVARPEEVDRPVDYFSGKTHNHCVDHALEYGV